MATKKELVNFLFWLCETFDILEEVDLEFTAMTYLKEEEKSNLEEVSMKEINRRNNDTYPDLVDIK